jgi:ABC-2 type transport system permease protein
MKLISLVKATLKDNAQIFRLGNEKKKSKISKMLLEIMVVALIMFSVGFYAAMFADKLKPLNLTFILITIFILITSFMTFMEGSYKSQSILFECKDNDFLMALPIDKKTILASRVIKYLYFQIIYNALFLVPAFIVYGIYEKPGFSYYILAILGMIILPIIPTILGAVMGTIIKMISSVFKHKKLFQTIFSIGFMVLIILFSGNSQNYVNYLIEHATGINDFICKFYYPAGLFVNLITNFKVVDLLALIGLTFGILLLFIYILSLYYFRLINKSIDYSRKTKKKYVIKQRSELYALIYREIKRFFSSPVYIMNTLFGLIMILGMVIALIFKSDYFLKMMVGTNSDISIDTIKNSITYYYMGMMLFVLFMTSITSSSISLEGKSFNLTKSLPVSTKKILDAKIITSLILTYPLMFLSDILFAITFKIGLLNFIFVILITLLVPILEAIIGLLINLKYPKMEFSNDTEVVKQSMSVMISVYLGMGLTGLIIYIIMKLKEFLAIDLCILLILCMVLLSIIILYRRLNNNGNKLFRKINV